MHTEFAYAAFTFMLLTFKIKNVKIINALYFSVIYLQSGINEYNITHNGFFVKIKDGINFEGYFDNTYT